MRRLAAAVALVLAPLTVIADEAPLPEVATALARIKDRSSIELTTIGRTTGREHTKPIWFVVADGKILVQSGKGGKTDWYANLRKTPAVVVRQGEYTFRARAVPVTDQRAIDRIHQLFLEKYLTAKLLSFVGSSIGRGSPVELTPIAVAVQH